MTRPGYNECLNAGIFTVSVTARLLRMSPSKVMRLCNSGKLSYNDVSETTERVERRIIIGSMIGYANSNLITVSPDLAKAAIHYAGTNDSAVASELPTITSSDAVPSDEEIGEFLDDGNVSNPVMSLLARMTHRLFGKIEGEKNKDDSAAAKQERESGIYHKYHVTRMDGTDAPGEKHHNCRYFVIDIDHDANALPALWGYALSCRFENPDLSNDLIRIVHAERFCKAYGESSQR